MKTIKAIRLASLVTAINVASGFSIAAIIRPQYLVPAESVPTKASLLLAMYAAAPRIPLALFVLGAIYKQATSALLILGALAGAMRLLDAGIGLFEHDLGKCAGPLFIAVLPFFVVYLLDVVVQNDTRHAWRNKGNKPDTILFFLNGARARETSQP
jgi:hypothetical protein